MPKKKPATQPKKSLTQNRTYNVLYAHRHYLLAAILLGIVFVSMFAATWLQGRLQANDTPMLLATQVAKQLDADLGLNSINMGGTDLASDPVPFVIVYDKEGKAVAGSGYLDNSLAVVPKGVLEHATKTGSNPVTWAPESGVRLATVTVATDEYYVLGGQSLAQTESHAKRVAILTAAGYTVTILVLLAYVVVRRFMPRA